MTVNLSPTTLPTPLTTITQSSSGSNASTPSIADLANEFTSLLANFAATQSNAVTSSAQTASGPSTTTPSSGSSATTPSAGGQTGNLAPGVAAFLFVSQTTTSPAPAQSSQPPLFASTDTDGNGLISQQEFVDKFGANGNQSAASQLFNVLDKNGDSQIDGTELASSNANATTGGRRPALRQHRAAPPGVPAACSNCCLGCRPRAFRDRQACRSSLVWTPTEMGFSANPNFRQRMAPITFKPLPHSRPLTRTMPGPLRGLSLTRRNLPCLRDLQHRRTGPRQRQPSLRS